MAVTFLEPGGDATFNVANKTNGGLWQVVSGTPTVVTDFVHGTHVKSIKFPPASQNNVITQDGTLADAGTRINFFSYINVHPGFSDFIHFFSLTTAGAGAFVIRCNMTRAGVLQLWTGNNSSQIGGNGATLATGQWYRISLAYTITSTTVNRFELFVNGVSSISITNATLVATGTSDFLYGNQDNDTTLDTRLSDIYFDNSNALTDPGNIWVTAKRPNANGTSNQFTTQIGAGGSGYGTGHSPQINERPLSNTNGWSIQNAAKQTEEYTIEGKAVGDIDISAATIVDFMGWVDCKVGVNSTGNIIVAGTATNISVTTAETMFTKVAGSSTYPTGNTDIGMDTNAVNQLFSLYECGIIVAYIPSAHNSNFLMFM